MEFKTVQELREAFLDFFKSKGHYIEESYPLIPEDDPSVLLIGAGMMPLKNYFMGVKTPPSPRMATCQKCIRIGDLENVGETSRHMTFFEMLGNFSFADYFKKESLEWGLEFLVDVLGIDKNLLWASVYEEDEESYLLWKDHLHFPAERIVKLGKEDNFWEIGLGPCGPCSEIYYDRGEVFSCGDPNCKPGCDCDRYIEIWNHVFTQFNKNADGSYSPLANKNIDTGMGLERLAMVIQQETNVFDVDHMRSILLEIEKVSGLTYGKDHKTSRSMRIIADHLRSITFMINDGVIVSNEGRGYILKKLIRRSALQTKKLQMKEGSLIPITKKVIEVYQEQYPALKTNEMRILELIQDEDNKFSQTLERGLHYLEGLLDQKTKVIKGKEVFKLYDTFGFPLDLTQELAQEKGKSIDEKGFHQEMEKQKQKARAASQNTSAGWNPELLQRLSKLPATIFTGYDHLDGKATILEIIQDGAFVDQINEGQAGLVLDRSPFYATRGGQVNDSGKIGPSQVFDVTHEGDLLLHHVKAHGLLKVGQEVELAVDKKRRRGIERNHTATHLLHETLIQELEGDVHQAGSVVEPNRLRFDFTFHRALTQDEIDHVEDIVNAYVLDDFAVTVKEMDLDEALDCGARALFSEKYGKRVRTITIGDYSMELCGGTHVRRSGEIGAFKILYERAVASGVRRIEAITGMDTLNFMRHMEHQQQEAISLLSSNKDQWVDQLQGLKQDYRNLAKEHDELKNQMNRGRIKEVEDAKHQLHDVDVYYYVFKDKSNDDLKTISDELLANHPKAFTLLISQVGNKLLLVSGATQGAIEEGFKSGKIIKTVATFLGGGGGGRDSFASAGGRLLEKLPELDQNIDDIIISNISK